MRKTPSSQHRPNSLAPPAQSLQYKFSKRCESECKICEDDYPREQLYVKAVRSHEAQEIIEDHVKAINECFEYISNIIKKRADKVLTRWKDKKRREAAIKKALPDVFSRDKWTTIEDVIAHKQGKALKQSGDERKAFLLPYLSREELFKDSSRLPRLINLRATYTPSEWAWADHLATKWGRKTDMLSMKFREDFFSLQHENYGQNVDFRHGSFHRRECLGFPTAEILFEAQHKLYTFLRGTLTALLANSEDKDTGCKLWEEQVTKNFSKGSNDAPEREFFEPIQPFQKPLEFDIKILKDLAEERWDAAENELWLLQTDPASAYNALAYIQQAACFQGLNGNEKWAAIAEEFCEPLFKRVGSWDRLMFRLNWLESVHDNHIKDPTNSSADRLDRTLDHIDISLSMSSLVSSRTSTSTLYSGTQCSIRFGRLAVDWTQKRGKE